MYDTVVFTFDSPKTSQKLFYSKSLVQVKKKKKSFPTELHIYIYYILKSNHHPSIIRVMSILALTHPLPVLLLPILAVPSQLLTNTTYALCKKKKTK